MTFDRTFRKEFSGDMYIAQLADIGNDSLEYARYYPEVEDSNVKFFLSTIRSNSERYIKDYKLSIIDELELKEFRKQFVDMSVGIFCHSCFAGFRLATMVAMTRPQYLVKLPLGDDFLLESHERSMQNGCWNVFGCGFKDALDMLFAIKQDELVSGINNQIISDLKSNCIKKVMPLEDALSFAKETMKITPTWMVTSPGTADRLGVVGARFSYSLTSFGTYGGMDVVVDAIFEDDAILFGSKESYIFGTYLPLTIDKNLFLGDRYAKYLCNSNAYLLVKDS